MPSPTKDNPINGPPGCSSASAAGAGLAAASVQALPQHSSAAGHRNHINPLVIESVTQPSNGVAGIRPDGTVIYKPDPDFAGEDSFTYQVCDRDGRCDEATVTVTVEPPPNGPPAAADDFVTISEGMRPGPTIPVLANDDDPDGDPLEVTGVTEPGNGTAVASPDGEGVAYEPDEEFTGVDCEL